uniref:1-phosphatidylinositol 4-kinase n=1 Tax=Leersia perrieri TaxID=77586 RepID=A0A0D9X960_9ORYZ
MAIAIDHTFNNDYPSKNQIEGRSLSWKRVFVQTDNGSVLGIELERGENAHTVKKKLQIALNIPTEESSLTCGDQLLNNDLSYICNDSPLLLTRNHMHRSCSTHCLSPNGKEVQHCDHSRVIEIVGCTNPSTRMKQLVDEIVHGIERGIQPVAISSGMGGVYYFMDIWGEHAAIVKLTDEEPFAPNNPKGYIGKSLGLPGLKALKDQCVLVNDKKTQALSKLASLQQFIPHDYDASDHGTSSFPVSDVHRIGILDIRIFNTDRHAGNILVRKLETGAGKFETRRELIPIDHGLCLPENLEDPYFEWIHWPQAYIPFSEEELEYIANLDPIKDAEMLCMELHMIHEASLRVLVLSTTFLKEAAAYGFCLSEIGEMMTRQFTGKEDEPSELEYLCMEAKKWVEETEWLILETDITGGRGDESTQFDLDCEDESVACEGSYFKSPRPFRGSSQNPLSKLVEGNEDEKEKDNDEFNKNDIGICTSPVTTWTPSTPNLLILPKKHNFSEISECHSGAAKNRVTTKIKKNDYGGNPRELKCGGWSANEMLPLSSSFVKLWDLRANEWSAFLAKFQDLLPSMFQERKQTATHSPWLMQRLGTSCQF